MACEHGSTSWMCSYCDAETIEREMNQCDGCRRRLPTRLGLFGKSMIHCDERGVAVMTCTKDRYSAALHESKESK